MSKHHAAPVETSELPPRESDTGRGLMLTLLAISGILIFLGAGMVIRSLQSLPPEPTASASPAAKATSSASASARPIEPPEPPPPPPLPESFLQAQRIEQKLLNHPNVTPGPGFYAPGVQSTGNTIVDAIDHAHASPLPRTPQP